MTDRLKQLKARIERKTGIVWGCERIVNRDYVIYVRIGWGGKLMPFECGFIWWSFYLGRY